MTAAEEIELFIAELDARIAGARGTQPDSAARLAAMRPIVVARLRADPEFFAQRIKGEALAIKAMRLLGIGKG